MEVCTGNKEEREEGPEWFEEQLGEGVAMATKVVKGFKEKVINTAMCLDLRKIRSKHSPLNSAIKGLL